MKTLALTTAVALATLMGAASTASADPWHGGYGRWRGGYERHDGYPGRGYGYGHERRFQRYGFPSHAYGYYGEWPGRRIYRRPYPAYGYYRY